MGSSPDDAPRRGDPGAASARNRRVAVKVVDAMMLGATLDRGLELIRNEIADVTAAGDAMFEVTVELRRLLDAQFDNPSTDWWLEVLGGCNIDGLSRQGLTSLLDQLALAARRDGPAVGLDGVGRPTVATLIQVATVHAMLQSLDRRYGHDAHDGWSPRRAD